MHPVVRLFSIGVVFLATCVAWMVLGGVTHERNNQQLHALRGKVTELWGSPQEQRAPELAFRWTTEETETSWEETQDGSRKAVTRVVVRTHEKLMSPSKSTIAVDLDLDMRRKGLMWYPLYDVDFEGGWSYRHGEPQDGELVVTFPFPTQDGIYDDFRLVVDGVDRARELVPEAGAVSWSVAVEPGQEVTIGAGYRSRGMTEWRYVPSSGVANIENFSLAMTTDFADIDFPAQTMSPSDKSRNGPGWTLRWDFDQVITGFGVGMVMPERIQPGELAAELAFSAPVSLLFFFLVIFALATLRGIELHPINYMFLAGAFFAFHLLFAYSADHLPVSAAFGLSSVVSVALVVSYLRLVVSPRFAFLEAAGAQMVYLVGFSLAHFWDGYTGLTVTALSIITLFLLMQWTGRIKWSEVLSRPPDPVAPRQAA
ncbi:MAG: inner membrane CreD family protein [Alphaproteobacteria bacterium]|nr:inner membrane CreD family protein [Alphaproteobacteria bacterium]